MPEGRRRFGSHEPAPGVNEVVSRDRLSIAPERWKRAVQKLSAAAESVRKFGAGHQWSSTRLRMPSQIEAEPRGIGVRFVMRGERRHRNRLLGVILCQWLEQCRCDVVVPA